MTIGRRIREARRDAGLTQRELAERMADLDHTAVSKIETGRRRVASHELFDLAEALGVTTSQLVGAPTQTQTLAVAGRLSTGGQPAFLGAAIERVRQILEMDDLLGRVAGQAAATVPPSVDRPAGGKAWTQGRALAAAARRALDLGTGPVASLGTLLETRFGAHVVSQPIGGNVHGLCVHDGHVTVVLVNSNDGWARQRYTVAHELAHILMDDLKTFEVTWDAERDDVCERRAESFAAYFLAPDAGLREAVAGRSVNEGIVAELMDYFGMSLESMCWRLVNAKLISSEQGDQFRSRGASAIARAASLDEAFDDRARRAERVSTPPRQLLRRALEAYQEGVIGAGVVAAIVGNPDTAVVRSQLDANNISPRVPEVYSGADLV